MVFREEGESEEFNLLEHPTEENNNSLSPPAFTGNKYSNTLTSPPDNFDSEGLNLKNLITFNSIKQLISEIGGEFLFYIAILTNLIAATYYASLLSVIELIIILIYSFKRWSKCNINLYIILLSIIILYQYIRELGIPPIGKADGWIMWPWMNEHLDYQMKLAFGGFTLTKTYADVIACVFLAMSRIARNVYIFNNYPKVFFSFFFSFSSYLSFSSSLFILIFIVLHS